MKFFFHELGKNFNSTKEFLLSKILFKKIEEFPEFYKEPKGDDLIMYGKQKNMHFTNNLQNERPMEFSKEINHKYENCSESFLLSEFSKNRREIQKVQKIYFTCSVQSSIAGQKSNYKNYNRFQSMKRNAEKKLNILKEESICIIYELSKRKGFTSIDLHGLFLDEAEEIVMIIIDTVKRILYRKGKNRSGKKNNFKVEIITGKGRNSKGKPILFPKIKGYLESEGYKVVPGHNNGKLDTFITL